MIGQPPLGAVLVGIVIVSLVVASFVGGLRFVVARRPEWRDRIAGASQVVAIGILAFATYSFLISSKESADFAMVPATATLLAALALALWWSGEGRVAALLSGIGAVAMALVLANPGFWAFNDLRMLWIGGLAIALITTAFLGRHGRQRFRRRSPDPLRRL